MARRKIQKEAEINLLPVMNLFVVLIPFLLMGVSFLQLGALGASTPVAGTASDSEAPAPTIVSVRVRNAGFEVSVEPGDAKVLDGTQLAWSLDKAEEGAALDEFLSILDGLKELFPETATLVVIPDRDVPYADVIDVMSTARPIFTNVTVTARVR